MSDQWPGWRGAARASRAGPGTRETQPGAGTDQVAAVHGGSTRRGLARRAGEGATPPPRARLLWARARASVTVAALKSESQRGRRAAADSDATPCTEALRPSCLQPTARESRRLCGRLGVLLDRTRQTGAYVPLDRTI